MRRSSAWGDAPQLPSSGGEYMEGPNRAARRAKPTFVVAAPTSDPARSVAAQGIAALERSGRPSEGEQNPRLSIFRDRRRVFAKQPIRCPEQRLSAAGGYPRRPYREPPPPREATAHETYLPTQRAPSQEEARLPVPHADSGRPRHREAPPCQRPQATLRVAAVPSCRCAGATASRGSTAQGGDGELVESWSSAGRGKPISRRSGSSPDGGWGTRCRGTAPSAGSAPRPPRCRCDRARRTWWSQDPRRWTPSSPA